VVAVINSAISLYYYIRVIGNMYMKAPEDATRFAPSWDNAWRSPPASPSRWCSASTTADHHVRGEIDPGPGATGRA